LVLSAIHERCSGCRACLLACSLENFKEMTTAKAALAIQGRFPAPGDYRVQLCDQCGDCAEACPVKAIIEKDGKYLIDEKLCTGCLECVTACPHGVMLTHPGMEEPIKCTLCGACVTICPREALVLEEGVMEGGAV
jgi:ferredoxin